MIDAVADRMRKAREESKPLIRRQDMAGALDVDFGTIGRWERGDVKHGPPIWAIAGYARETGVPVAVLLGEDVPKEALTAALQRSLLDRLSRIDREFSELRAQFGDDAALGNDA